jgi:hypothetical protein
MKGAGDEAFKVTFFLITKTHPELAWIITW